MPSWFNFQHLLKYSIVNYSSQYASVKISNNLNVTIPGEFIGPTMAFSQLDYTPGCEGT